MEILRRWREPVAVTLLITAGLRLLVGIVAVPVLASDEAWGSFATAALFEGTRAADTVLLLATVAAAACCLLSPPTPSGRTIAALALVETAVAILVSLVFGLMGLASSSVGRGLELVQLLTTLALPAVAAALLLALLRALPSAAVAASPRDQLLAPRPVDPNVDPNVDPDAPPMAQPTQAPSWQSESATGMVWQTAGEAAAGAPPTSWPPTGEPAGWQPIPGSADPPQTNRSP